MRPARCCRPRRSSSTEAGARGPFLVHRYAWPSELDLMARLSGMTLEQRWSDWHGHTFDARSSDHVSVWRSSPPITDDQDREAPREDAGQGEIGEILIESIDEAERVHMKAVTWQAKRSVSVDSVPDPVIKESTDAIVRITSTNICGSDLHTLRDADRLHGAW